MNKELYDRPFPIPENILNFISQELASRFDESDGIRRAKRLLKDQSVTYQQLKRILHDMKNLDKTVEMKTYNLYGGELFEKWGWSVLSGERNLIRNNKDSSRNVNDIVGGLEDRRNPYLKSHSKKQKFTFPTNNLKSNSDRTSVSALGLSEQINKIKKIINDEN